MSRDGEGGSFSVEVWRLGGTGMLTGSDPSRFVQFAVRWLECRPRWLARSHSGPSLLVLALFLGLSLAAVFPVHRIQAGPPAGYSEFYTPGSEEQMFNIFRDLPLDLKPVAASGMHAVIAVTSTADETTVYYDHWEDGYDFDPANPLTADETYVLSRGEVKRFESSSIPVLPRGLDTYYDGGDCIFVAGGAVTVTRASWPQSTGTVFALAWEILPTKAFLTTYTIPVGEDLSGPPKNYDDFDRVYTIVQSINDGNRVRIDDPLTPGIEVDTILNKGATTQLYHINHGTTVTGDQPVQVQFIVGDEKPTYEARGYTAVPDGLWDDEYYNPVGGFSSGKTDLYLYNPNDEDIEVDFEDLLGTGSFTIAAGDTLAYSDGAGRSVPQDSGVYLTSANTFWGVGSADSEWHSYDWGYSLVPAWALDNERFLGWAPGTSEAVPKDNGSPLFITPTQDQTLVLVDFSPTDGVFDASYLLDRLESQKIFDGDNDNTGMHVRATGPIVMAWGEDPDTASPINPFLDLGYTTLPVAPEWIDAVLGIEKTAQPTVLPPGPGQTAEFTAEVETFDYAVQDVDVVDTLPPGWIYVPLSTTITLPDSSIVSGAPAEPSISGPVLTWDLNQDMGPGQSLRVVFQGQTTEDVPGGISRNDAQARGVRLDGVQVFSPIDSAFIFIRSLTIDKDTSTPTVESGGVATYTIRLENVGGEAIGNVTVSDDLPTGFSFVSESIVEDNATRTSSSSPVPGETSPSWGTWDIGAGGSVTITFDVLVDDSVPAGTYDNTASAESTQTGPIDDEGEVGQDQDTPFGEDPEDDEDVTVWRETPQIEVSKSPDPSVVTEPGGTVEFTVEVTNAGANTVTLTSLLDDVYGDVSNEGTCALPVDIAPAASYSCAFDGEVAGSAGESKTDTVTAEAQDEAGNVATAQAEATVHILTANKALVDTDQDHTTGQNVTIGEILTYEINLAFPPGVLSNVSVMDELDLGLAYVDCVSITPSSPDLTLLVGDFPTACASAEVEAKPPGNLEPEDQGRRVRFNFGDVSNASDGNETLTIRYRAIALNIVENQQGGVLGNSARWQWDARDTLVGRALVTLVEPDLKISKDATSKEVGNQITVTYTLTVRHTAGSGADAYDLELADTLPPQVTYMPGTLKHVSGPPPSSLDASGAPTLRAKWDVFVRGEGASVIRYKVRGWNLPVGTNLVNRTQLEWTSLEGPIPDPRSDHNTLSGERLYVPEDIVNDYVVQDFIIIPVTGFAPGRVTQLPSRPDQNPYQGVPGMWLEIPSLGARAAITSVPRSENGWDITWLWDQAGYLEGTAFPTWSGNTGITAHVYLSSGLPGPFARLKELRWGDEVIIQAYGSSYVYEVREVRFVRPSDLSILGHEDRDWLTLITCFGYSERRDTYLWRVAARAVLVEVR